MDSFRQGQISQSDCEISSNCGKKIYSVQRCVSFKWYPVLHIFLPVLINSTEIDNQNTGPYSFPAVTER